MKTLKTLLRSIPSIIIILCSEQTLYAMDAPKIIPKAGYYLVHPANTCSYGGIEATFYAHESIEDLRGGVVWYRSWDEEKQKVLDSMIDTAAVKPSITHAEIFTCTSFGRRICYYSGKHECVRVTSYDGPLDIKQNGSRMDLIKPHGFLSQVKKVEEWNDALPLQGVLSFFYPTYRCPYVKKRLIYNNDGTTTETVTNQHRLVQSIYAAIGIGILYGTAVYIGRIIKCRQIEGSMQSS